MKKIIYLLAAAATLFAASCNKMETSEQELASDTIKLNINVANITGAADTKAAKTGWVSGDKINIWFDDWNFTEKAENHTPDMVIIYNGSAWTVSSQVSGLSSRLKANGKLTALFEGFNDLSKYTYQYYNGEWFHPAYTWQGIAGDNVYNSQMVVAADALSYSYSEGTITANLDNWNFHTQFKVLLKNDNSKLIHSADKYYLQVKNITADPEACADTKGAIVVKSGSVCPIIGNGSSNYNGFAGGVQEADGIAFYYVSLSANNEDIQFTLYNSQDATVTTYTATGKTVTCNNTKCTGVAINYSKFTTLP